MGVASDRNDHDLVDEIRDKGSSESGRERRNPAEIDV